MMGTRGSQLSLVQTDIIKNLLLRQNSSLQLAVKIIKTKGDKNMSPIPLDSIGKGWFTKELDSELLQGTIDLAVHSLKDLPETLPNGLVISAVSQREDAREALVSTSGLTLSKLPKGAIIGTDSTRRKAQILHKRADLEVRSVRGNINSRLEKLDMGEYDGLLLAAAGLKRLGLQARIAEYFDPIDLIPSPGQGALAVVTRKSDGSLNTLLEKINHNQTMAIVCAERAFSAAAGGGCKMPVGAYAVCNGDTLTLYGVVGSLDGTHLKKDKIIGKTTKPLALGKVLAERLLKDTWWFNKEAGY